MGLKVEDVAHRATPWIGQRSDRGKTGGRVPANTGQDVNYPFLVYNSFCSPRAARSAKRP